MASKGRPYRTLRLDGFEVLIGRGSAENEHVTFELAAPDDLWLHVADGTAGSHVVIRNPQRAEVPEAVVHAAAAAAAWFSKARGQPQARVHVCRAGDVRKPKGAREGTVTVSRTREVRVRPGLPASNVE